MTEPKAPAEGEIVEKVARKHPPDLGQTALRWYCNFDWGAPHNGVVEALTEFVAARDAWLETTCDSDAEEVASLRLDAAHRAARRALASRR